MQNRPIVLSLVAALIAVVPATSHPAPPSAPSTSPASQPAAPRFGKPVRSPEVADDRRVTFRFLAPGAAEVVVLSDELGRLAMIKNDAGVWQITTEPLEPDFYTYRFVIDGVAVADPANTLNKPGVTGGHSSIVHVPGPASLLWEMNDVPRGVVHHHRYRSARLDGENEFYVYSPPGYDAAGKRAYPVLYLLHGVGDDARGWTTAGRANVILDKLTARGEAEPMLVVMPLGYGFANPADRVGEIFAPLPNHREMMDAFADTLLDEVIPEVERVYLVDARRDSLPLGVLSIGGTQALYIGLYQPSRFIWGAAFSGAFIMYAGMYDVYFPDVKAEDRPAQDVWIACGKKDFLFPVNRSLDKWLTSKGVEHKFTRTPGGHTWTVWRRNLGRYAKTLFRDKPGS